MINKNVCKPPAAKGYGSQPKLLRDIHPQKYNADDRPYLLSAQGRKVISRRNDRGSVLYCCNNCGPATKNSRSFL
jgi:hypothetical protein